jgi:hypothetical protein
MLAGPVPGQEIGDALWMIRQACKDVGEPGLRVDGVELGSVDQRVDRGGAVAAFVGAGERPVLAAQGDAAQRAFGGVVRHAQAAVVEEAGERIPALESIIDSLAGLASAGEFGPALAQESVQISNERAAALGAQREAFCGRKPIDLALDCEQRMNCQLKIDP